jgi:hypothetical protein
MESHKELVHQHHSPHITCHNLFSTFAHSVLFYTDTALHILNVHFYTPYLTFFYLLISVKTVMISIFWAQCNNKSGGPLCIVQNWQCRQITRCERKLWNNIRNNSQSKWQRCAVASAIFLKKQVPECHSGLRLSKKELPEWCSGMFCHKNIPGCSKKKQIRYATLIPIMVFSSTSWENNKIIFMLLILEYLIMMG